MDRDQQAQGNLKGLQTFLLEVLADPTILDEVEDGAYVLPATDDAELAEANRALGERLRAEGATVQDAPRRPRHARRETA